MYKRMSGVYRKRKVLCKTLKTVASQAISWMQGIIIYSSGRPCGM